MLAEIRNAGFAITVLDANGSEYSGEKYMIVADVDKTSLSEYKSLVKELDKDAFILVLDTKNYFGGYFGKGK